MPVSVLTEERHQLDNRHLLADLIRRAKSSHSSLGRTADADVSRRVLADGLPVGVEPAAIFLKCKEHRRELDAQRAQIAAWEETRERRAAGGSCAASSFSGGGGGGGLLRVRSPPARAPPSSAAASPGVRALGGVRVEGPGYASLLAPLATARTIAQLHDSDEILSSPRPFVYDVRAEQRRCRGDDGAPLAARLRGLEPILAGVHPRHLVDARALAGGAPPRLWTPRDAATDAGKGPGHAAKAKAKEGEGEGEGQGGSRHEPLRGERAHRGGASPPRGTCPFTDRARDPPPRHIPGVRQPALGQYHVRHGVVEGRVKGGYIEPPRAPVPAAVADAISRFTNDAYASLGALRGRGGGGEWAAASLGSDSTRLAATTLGGGGGGGDATNSSGTNPPWAATAPPRRAPAKAAEGEGGSPSRRRHSLTTLEPRRARPGWLSRSPSPSRGENAKGSAAFLSTTARSGGRGEGGGDLVYAPIPTASSRTPRPRCFVRYDVPTNGRRRRPAACGIPMRGTFEATTDIGKDRRRRVDLARATGRETHWYGKPPPPSPRARGGGEGKGAATSLDFADLEQALRATRPAAKAARLAAAPRSTSPNAARGADSKPASPVAHAERDAERGKGAAGFFSASSPPRGCRFERMLGRDELPRPLPLTVNLIYDVDDAAVAKHVPCAHLAAHGICHRKGRLGARNPSTATSERNDSPPPPPSSSEVGGIPSLRWVKPRTSRSARFGASRGGSARRELPTLQEAPLRVLEPSFALVEPRVRGNPMIGSTISREKRERRFAGAHAESESETAGVGAGAGGVGGGAGGPLGVHSPSRFGSYRPSVTPAGQRGSHAPAVDDMFSLISPKVKSIPQFDKQVPRESPVISHNRLL